MKISDRGSQNFRLRRFRSARQLLGRQRMSGASRDSSQLLGFDRAAVSDEICVLAG